MSEIHDYSFVKLSLTENEDYVHKEKNKWRKLRLQQVQAQTYERAAVLQEACKKEELKQRHILWDQLENSFEENKHQRIDLVREDHLKNIQEFGLAQKVAKNEICYVDSLNKQKLRDRKVAHERGRKAMDFILQQKQEKENYDMIVKLKQKHFVEEGKRRAQNVAQRDVPSKFKYVSKTHAPGIPRRVMLFEAGTLTSSAYEPSVMVVKESLSEVKASDMAKNYNGNVRQTQEIKRLKEFELSRRARERGQIALWKEKMKQWHSELLENLKEAGTRRDLSNFFHGEVSSNSLKIESLHEVESAPNGKMQDERVKEVIHSELKEVEEAMNEYSGESSTPKHEVGFQSKCNSAMKPEELIRDLCVKNHEIEENLRFSNDLLMNSESICYKETMPIREQPFMRKKYNFEDMSKHDDLINRPTVSDSSSKKCHPKLDMKVFHSKGSKFEECLTDILKSAKGDQSLSASSSTGSEFLSSIQNLKRKLDSYWDVEQNCKPLTPSSSSSSFLSIPQFLLSTNKAASRSYDLKNDSEAVSKTQNSQVNFDYSKKQFMTQVFFNSTTPVRTYNEPVKVEGDGEKLQTKKEKFDQKKKDILRYYVERLLPLKMEEMEQISTTSCSSSGVDLSSVAPLGCEMKCRKNESSSLSHTFKSLSRISETGDFDVDSSTCIKIVYQSDSVSSTL